MLKDAYEKYISTNGYKKDINQLALIDLLTNYISQIERSKNLIYRLFNKNTSEKHGVYLWGKVGRGKTFIFNIFYNNLKINNKHKQHFHEFMLDCHEKINYLNQQKNVADKVAKLAKDISQKFKVLYLDEFQVNNIADAMLLSKIFTELIANGTYIFLTSNSKPQEIYKNGLKREYIYPFIELLLEKIEIFNLDTSVDFRKESLKEFKLFMHPHNEEKFQLLISNFFRIEDYIKTKIKISENRYLYINRSVGKIARFTFDELCVKNLGSTDYIGLCKRFTMLIIENIPQLKFDNHNEALRFITLIDCMYDKKIVGIFSAEKELDKLYIGKIHSAEFERTISRIYEMQSDEYLHNCAANGINNED